MANRLTPDTDPVYDEPAPRWLVVLVIVLLVVPNTGLVIAWWTRPVPIPDGSHSGLRATVHSSPERISP